MPDLTKYKSVSVPNDTYEKLFLMSEYEKRNLSQQLSLLIDLELERLTRPLASKKEDFDVLRAVKATKARYIRRALDNSKNVSSASKLLGLKNYQTLQNWMQELEF